MSVFTGTAGDDSITGTGGADDFHIEQGGIDTVLGGGGKDVFYLGASLTADDRLDGGGGGDVLVLDGDYSSGLAFASATMKRMETVLLTGGHDYVLRGFSDANFSGGASFFGGTLGKNDSMQVNASELTLGVHMLGGAGADKLVGGSGYNTLDGNGGKDTLIGGDGGNSFILASAPEKAKGGAGNDVFVAKDKIDFSGADKLNGGAGFDTLQITDFHTELHFTDQTVKNIEEFDIDLYSGAYLNLTMADGNVAAGHVLTVHIGASAGDMKFDGSAETDGSFIITNENTYDYIIGGAQADTITTSFVDNTIQGGGGADILQSGSEHARFVYTQLSDSSADAADTISGVVNTDVIDLQAIDADTSTAGDQAFHLVSAFGGHAGELTVIYNNARHVTTISGDADGDGIADLVIQLSGSHADFNSFAL